MRKRRSRCRDGRSCACRVAAVLIVAALRAGAATPLGGQDTSERMERRLGDQQAVQLRMQATRLHESVREEELMQPQTRITQRAREWREEVLPQSSQQFDGHLDKQRRVRAMID